MISLLILDHPSLWTATGALIKYGSIVLMIMLGFAIYSRSKLIYVALVVPLFFVPYSAISMADRSMDVCMDMGKVVPCGWHYVWLSIGIAELQIVWVPLFGFMLKKGAESAKSA